MRVKKEGLRLKGAQASFRPVLCCARLPDGGKWEYSFILEGYDEQWASFSSANEASYTDVPAGDYTF